MITRINSTNPTSPTFKAKVSIDQWCSSLPHKLIRKQEVDIITKEFEKIGDNKDFFKHTLDDWGNGFVKNTLEYYRENCSKKLATFKLISDYSLTPVKAINILMKSAMAYEPIENRITNNIDKKVKFPEYTCLRDCNIEYCDHVSHVEDNFYYKNGKKAVCVQEINPHKSVAEYYDKNGNLQFRKYKSYSGTLTEKYNKDGEVSYKVVSDAREGATPIVMKDNKLFQLYSNKINVIDAPHGVMDYRVLTELDDDESIRYYLDSRGYIRPENAPRERFGTIGYYNVYPEKTFLNRDISVKKANQEYVNQLMKINPLYTPEHLKELYDITQDFTEKFIEDDAIFQTNYGIHLIDNKLKPVTKDFYYDFWDKYKSIPENKRAHYNELVATVRASITPDNANFTLSARRIYQSSFRMISDIWNQSIYRLEGLLNQP